MFKFDLDNFKRYFCNDKNYEIPRRWDGKDFVKTLQDCFECYNKGLVGSLWFSSNEVLPMSGETEEICRSIIDTLNAYLDGKESAAFDIFYGCFKKLMKTPLLVDQSYYLQKKELISKPSRTVALYRVRQVEENREYGKSDIFHVPFDARNKISTNRFSISGYPSLYLSSSIDLCLEESEYRINLGRYIASKYVISPIDCKNIEILDLAIKPSDFALADNKDIRSDTKRYKRQYQVKQQLINNPDFIYKYILWYPIILACSFMRINRKDPFSVEYVIPQLLMQAIRIYNENKIVGIRYFSCSSVIASDMGFNYVFPTKMDKKENKYCSELRSIFKMTDPVFLHEYTDIRYADLALNNMKLDYLIVENPEKENTN